MPALHCWMPKQRLTRSFPAAVPTLRIAENVPVVVAEAATLRDILAAASSGLPAAATTLEVVR